jgi:hypothetical protein
MISVILPTLWKLNFNEELVKLNNCKYVGEIILINNKDDETPDWFNAKQFDKLVEIRPLTNLYVNPSWNMGVRIANHEHILLHSDDMVASDYTFFERIDQFLKENDALIGVGENCYSHGLSEDSEISFREVNPRPYGYGCMMFFRKESYKPLPKEYLLFRGDDMIIDYFRSRQKQIYVFDNIKMNSSRLEVTSGSPEFSSIKQSELYNVDYNSVLQEYLK